MSQIFSQIKNDVLDHHLPQIWVDEVFDCEPFSEASTWAGVLVYYRVFDRDLGTRSFTLLSVDPNQTSFFKLDLFVSSISRWDVFFK